VTRPRQASLACLALLLAAWAPGAAHSADEDALRYKFKEGDKLRYITEVRTAVEAKLTGDDVVKFNNILVTESTWQVTKVDKDGRAAVTVSLDRLRLTVDGPMGKLEYDTKDGKEPDEEFFRRMTENLKAVVGGQFTLTVDPRGQAADVKLLDKLAKISDAGDLMKALVENLLPLPEGKAKKGDSWSQKTETTGPQVGKVAVEKKYVSEGPAERAGRKVEKVSIKQTMTQDPKAAPAGVKATFDGGEGTAYFDRAAGRLLEMTVTQGLQTEAKVEDRTLTKKLKIVVTTKLADNEKRGP
jgi:hypothetical protein